MQSSVLSTNLSRGAIFVADLGDHFENGLGGQFHFGFRGSRARGFSTRVSVPVSTECKAILEKYNYQLPHLEDQVINRYIKDIGEKAGLTEYVEIETTKGGDKKKEKFRKCDLIHTHTARRTGATLMYLSGMDIYDIIKITGHTSPVMLRKYIKADQLQVVNKIVNKYNYFD